MDQDEIACHALGERRINYLNQIRCILEQMEDNVCTSKCSNASKPFLEYPGYVNRKNPEFKRSPLEHKCVQNEPQRDCSPLHEQPTAPKNVKVFMSVQVPVQAHVQVPVQAHVQVPRPGSHQPEPRPRCDSFELVGGEFFSGCSCTRYNGLQDQCRRRECNGNPACITEPQPSCIPSRMIPDNKDRPIYQKFEEEFKRRLSHQDQTYLC